MTCRLAAIVLFVSCHAAAVLANEVDDGGSMMQVRRTVAATVISEAPIFLDPKVTRTPLTTVLAGTTLEVLNQSGDWVQVQFNDRAFGRRVGWIEARHVRIEQADFAAPAPAEPRGRETPPLTKIPPPPPAPQILVDRPAGRFERGWVDFNIGLGVPSGRTYSVRSERLVFEETATFEADYQFPAGFVIDAAGGVMLTRALGVGIGISRATHKDPAVVRATIPHPLRFNALGTGEGETEEELTRAERNIHFQGTFTRIVSPELRYRLFAGPTYVKVSQDTVSSIGVSQDFQLQGTGNVITIVTTPFAEAEATAWGFHVGADASFFTDRTAGVGVLARFSRAKVDLIDLGGAAIEHNVGGFHASVGLRLKF